MQQVNEVLYRKLFITTIRIVHLIFGTNSCQHSNGNNGYDEFLKDTTCQSENTNVTKYTLKLHTNKENHVLTCTIYCNNCIKNTAPFLNHGQYIQSSLNA